MTTRSCPASTAVPSAQRMACTAPARGARSSFSIFMASSTTAGWPAATVSPGLTSSLAMRPGMGERMVTGALLAAPASGAAPKAKPRKRAGGKAAAASGDSVTAPMQGTIVKIAVEDGQSVEPGDLIVVLEAMKMENPVTAHKAGTVTGLNVSQGETVTQGTALCELKD